MTLRLFQKVPAPKGACHFAAGLVGAAHLLLPWTSSSPWGRCPEPNRVSNHARVLTGHMVVEKGPGVWWNLIASSCQFLGRQGKRLSCTPSYHPHSSVHGWSLLLQLFPQETGLDEQLSSKLAKPVRSCHALGGQQWP